MTRALASLAACVLASCAIAEDDLLPGIGEACNVDDALCPLEHACRPSSPGKDTGVCEPVLTYGTCAKPTHPPGRIGESADHDVIIDQATDLENKLKNVRLIKGKLQIAPPGGGSDLDLEDICVTRALEHVEDGVIIDQTSLVSLDGLQSLTSVSHGLAITENARLEDLDALAHLVKVEPCRVEIADVSRSVHVVIAKNAKLPASAVDAFLADLEDRTGAALDVLRCENGPSGDRDGACILAENNIVNAIHDGDFTCR